MRTLEDAGTDLMMLEDDEEKVIIIQSFISSASWKTGALGSLHLLENSIFEKNNSVIIDHGLMASLSEYVRNRSC